jgi:AbrB family looped-hinge helix DNA binding protein
LQYNKYEKYELTYKREAKLMRIEKKEQGLYAWTAKVGSKGQIVIPKEARDLFNINSGDTVLLLGDKSQGIALVSGDNMKEMLRKIKGELL